MLVNKSLGFLFLAILVMAAPLTQNDVDGYVRSNNFVPASATLDSFKQDNDKFILIYKDQFTSFKLIFGQNAEGKLNLILR